MIKPFYIIFTFFWEGELAVLWPVLYGFGVGQDRSEDKDEDEGEEVSRTPSQTPDHPHTPETEIKN